MMIPDQQSAFTGGETGQPTERKAVLVRADGPGIVSRFFGSVGRSLREWGYTSGLYRARLKGKHISQLLASPDDPAPGNATLGSAILGGDMLFDGDELAIDELFWGNLKRKSEAFQTYAHSFHWLQDLAQVSDQAKARASAEALMQGWLADESNWGTHYDKHVWEAETLARRLINWLSHAPLLLSAPDMIYRSQILHALARQTRHLVRTHTDAAPGLARIYTASALVLAGACLPDGKNWYTRGVSALRAELQSFILADGAPASRNPADAIRTTQLLVLVRECHKATSNITDHVTGNDIPAFIQVTLDRLAPFIRAMRHSDGSFAQFGGVSAEGGHGTDAVLAASEGKGKAIDNMAKGGYQRVVAGRACLIMDTGTPPAPYMSEHAHASAGAIEFSHGLDRIIVGMGPASPRGPLKGLDQMARATAAHSAMTLCNRNTNRILDNGKLGEGVKEARTKRVSLDGETHLHFSHDGYKKRFGAMVTRSLTLSAGGTRLTGLDSFKTTNPRKIEKSTSGSDAIVRFHLHPGITCSKTADGTVILETRSGHSWAFKAAGTVTIDDSLYLPRPMEPRQTKALTITLPAPANGGAQKDYQVEWSLTKIESPDT